MMTPVVLPGRDDVSVVIVNYNAGSLLTECVRGALAGSRKVLVVDNDSTDGSLLECERQFGSDPYFGCIRNGYNAGFAAACNVGLRACSTEYILFLNPDCSLEAGAIARMLEVFAEQSDVGMVGGLLLNEDGSEQGGGRRAVPTPWRSLVRMTGLSRFSSRWPKLFFDFYLHKQPLPLAPIDVEAISGACMLVSRAAVDDVGNWDEGYFLHCEDLDWCMRFRQKEWRIVFVPTARVVHALGACSRNRPIFVEWHKHRGMMRFYRKFFRHQYPGLLMWIVAVGVWTRFALLASVHFIRGLRGRVGDR